MLNTMRRLFKGISIYSWIGTLSPGFPIAALLSTRNTTIISALLASTYALVHALSALLLEILNLNLLNPELIEMPLRKYRIILREVPFLWLTT